MNRSFVILSFLVILLLFIAEVVTEPVRKGDFTKDAVVINCVFKFLLALGMAAYCGFAAVHAVQRVSDPCDRAGWLMLIIPFTIFGSAIYLLTKYQHFRTKGEGSLICNPRKQGFSEFFQLSEEEQKSG